MRKKKLYIVLIVLNLLIISCGGNKSGDGDEPGEVLNPAKATLIFPENDEECTGGVVVSNEQAKLTFDWNDAANTTSYKLFVKNLNTDVTQDFSATTNSKEITIDRGVPYSWYVVSESEKTTEKATSDVWKFYLAGAGIENYAPFPAELQTPTKAESIAALLVNFKWSVSDVDDDLKEYDVYLDTNASPTTKLATTSSQKLDNQSVESGKTYYWKIITHDTNGNTSTSEIYSFTTN